MPEKKRLREALIDLRQRLDAGEELDAEERSMLVSLHDRIEATLDLTGEVAPVQRAEAHVETEDAARTFAVRYPQVAAALERVAETLVAIGF